MPPENASLAPGVSDEERELLARARHLALHARGPARSHAGALARTRDGALFPGISVQLETAAGLSVCAEQVAMSAARAATSEPIVEIALWIPVAAGEHPCGRCRQVWQELAAGARFILQRGDGEPQVLDLAALLPDPFTHFDPQHPG